jgi:hypothetical protein
MKLWPYTRDHGYLQDVLLNKSATKQWTKIFDSVYQYNIDTWCYQWTFSCWVQNGLTVLPNVNLVSNIGFGKDATHTSGEGFAFSKMPVFNLPFPIKHPEWMIKDDMADDYTQKINFNQPNIFHRAVSRLYRLVSKCLVSFP